MADPDAQPGPSLRPGRTDWLLLTAGAALMLTQYVAVREIGSTFFSTELVALGAVVVTMIGPSIAYALAHRLGSTALAVWGTLSVAAHLLLPVGLRAMVGALKSHGFELWALGLTALGGSLLLCGFYAIFLPRQAREPVSLPRLYTTELLGAMAALVLIAALPSWHAKLVTYWAVAVVVIQLGLGRTWLTTVVTLFALLLACLYPRLDRAAAATYYRGYWGLKQPVMVSTAYSAYHRVDVLDDPTGRQLYLDGVPFFRRGALEIFNNFIAEVPGRLQTRRGPALLIGSGSFQQAGYLHRLGYRVTVVELDPAVARTGFSNFAHIHRLRPGDVRLRIDDGRRFLRSTDQTYNLIIVDVPAPFHLQTALLHTPGFYRVVKAHLRDGGAATINLAGYLRSEIGGAIAASAASVFEDLIAVESRTLRRAHLYAGRRLPFAVPGVKRLLAERDPSGGRVFGDNEVRRRVAGVAPLTEDNLAAVLVLARRVLPEVLGGR